MGELIAAAFRAVGSLLTPGMMGVFVLSIVVTLLTLFGFVVAASCFFSWVAMHYALAGYIPWLGGLGSALAAWMLFPGIMPIIISFFDMRITRVIEQHDYPASLQVTETLFWKEFWHDVRFSLKAVLLNILVLPLYLVPGVNLILFYWLNGYLLGREYFVMAARRHMPVAQAEALRRKHSGAVLGGGILLTLVATIPVVNLFAPFWGVAVMVHLYHLVSVRTEAIVLPPLKSVS